MEPEKRHYRKKVIVLGEGGVGKTTLLYRYVNEVFKDSTKMTIGSDFFMKKIITQQARITLLLWDFAGQDRFTPLWPMLLRGTHVILLITDSTVENVLSTKRVFMGLIKKARPDAIVLGIANKQDLPKAMSGALVKRVLSIREVHGLCAIDPSERRKLQGIIAHAIELYLAQQAEKESLL